MSGGGRCPVCALLASLVGRSLAEAVRTLRARRIDRRRCTVCGLPWAAHALAHPHGRAGGMQPCTGLEEGGDDDA